MGGTVAPRERLLPPPFREAKQPINRRSERALPCPRLGHLRCVNESTRPAPAPTIMAMPGPKSPRPRALTVGSLVERDQGINLHCKCGHRTALLPAQIAGMAHPQTRMLDFKRKFRCSMCGRSGASEDIALTTFEVITPFVDHG